MPDLVWDGKNLNPIGNQDLDVAGNVFKHWPPGLFVNETPVIDTRRATLDVIKPGAEILVLVPATVVAALLQLDEDGDSDEPVLEYEVELELTSERIVSRLLHHRTARAEHVELLGQVTNP